MNKIVSEINNMNKIVSEINKSLSENIFYELSFFKLEKNNLIIVGSDDLAYFHNIEIEFSNVYSIECNYYFRIEPSKAVISLIENDEEAISINKKYGVTQGNHVFKILSEDNQEFYIISESISFREKVVKYF